MTATYNDQVALALEVYNLPDSQTVIWPLNADPKIAIATSLLYVLKAIGFTGDKAIPVIMMGSFHKSQLYIWDKSADPSEKNPALWKAIRSQPVVVVSRSSDRGERAGIGETFGPFTLAQMSDPDKVLANLGAVEALVYGQWSVANIDINIMDTNARRIERLYGIIKLLMIQIQNTLLNSCGFVEVSRVDGGDGQDITTDNPVGVGIVFERHLSYRVKYPEPIVLISQLVELAQLYFFSENDPSGQATITVQPP